jgi:hypothetical protein
MQIETEDPAANSKGQGYLSRGSWHGLIGPAQAHPPSGETRGATYGVVLAMDEVVETAVAAVPSVHDVMPVNPQMYVHSGVA